MVEVTVSWRIGIGIENSNNCPIFVIVSKVKSRNFQLMSIQSIVGGERREIGHNFQ